MAMRVPSTATSQLRALTRVHAGPRLSARSYLTLHTRPRPQTPNHRYTLFHHTSCGINGLPAKGSRSISNEQKAKDLNQQGVDEALSSFDSGVAEEKEKQVRTPWHREGVDEPPVRKQRSAGAMTKGKWTRAACR